MTSLDALLRRASRIAEQQFKKHGEVTAFWLVEKPDGTQEIIVSPIPTGSRAKDEMAAALSKVFQERGVWRYACARELGQSARRSKLPSLRRSRTRRIRFDPRRRRSRDLRRVAQDHPVSGWRAAWQA